MEKVDVVILKVDMVRVVGDGGFDGGDDDFEDGVGGFGGGMFDFLMYVVLRGKIERFYDFGG